MHTHLCVEILVVAGAPKDLKELLVLTHTGVSGVAVSVSHMALRYGDSTSLPQCLKRVERVEPITPHSGANV